MKKRNIVYSILIIALGVFVLFYAGRYAKTTSLGSGSTGGDFFPRLMAGGLIITGTFVLLSALFFYREEQAQGINWISLLLSIATLIIYFLLLRPLGFIVDSIWIVALMMYKMGCKNKIALIIWSIAMPLLIFCVFYYLLYVGLPMGVLSSILPKY